MTVILRDSLRSRTYCVHEFMFGSEEGGVVIAGPGAGLRLSRGGEANWFGYPTLLDVRAGPLAGSYMEDSVGPFAEFRNALVRMRDSVSGSASLTSDGGTYVELVCARTGIINVSARVAIISPGVHMIGLDYPIDLKFYFQIDQTYLSRIIRAVAQEFP